ncbi:MAG TPA: sugar phosphate isomerase/epimerase [Candidatus Limiplasma pullistercoris]|nr:sugar phosphate isomerase/epimerase [Candidatus Limiplasma pullistercoris]
MFFMQNYEVLGQNIRRAFAQLKAEHPQRLEKRLNFSWSNWGFGLEPLERSLERLAKNDIRYVELHGNHYGDDLGYDAAKTKKVLADYGIACAGVCGMFSADNDLSSNRHIQRQAAIDYIKREVAFTAEMGGKYMLVCPAAVGRPGKYDDSEIARSIDSLSRVADLFVQYGVRAAIEPIRAAETSVVHTFEQAKDYIRLLNHPGVQHINGDVYHMLVGEKHIGQAIWDAGDMLTNLHMADTNRCALGDGFMDIKTIIRALYLIGYNNNSCFVTPEPLGPGGDPYPAQNAITPPEQLDELVSKSVRYFRLCEEEVLAE